MSTELDPSAHALNTSPSKLKFSFPKCDRFKKSNRAVCDSYYDVPNTRSRRSTSFGYGQKTMGIRNDKHTAPIGAYQALSDFTPKTNRGCSFGKGRDEMELGGPLKNAKLQKYIPGPGNYNIKSSLEENTITLGTRLPDNSQKHLQKLPGPGTYKSPEIGSKMYYITSNHRNYTNHRIPPSARLTPISQKTESSVGPGSYSMEREELKPHGRYALSHHENSRSRIFDKSPRAELLYKHMVGTPGPGQYAPFSDFGYVS